MDLGKFLADSLEGSTGLLKMTLGDMSDAELRERPVEGANTPNWQIGHVMNAQNFLLAECGAPPFSFPAGFQEAYGGKGSAGGEGFGKEQLLGLFDQMNKGAAGWVRGLSPEQLAAPTPEKYRNFAGTVAAMINMMPAHLAMHLGQIQVLRRKLGKPILF
jgi:hypothetical protein